MTKKLLIIICGNYQEFCYYRNKIYDYDENVDIKYITEPQRLRGLRGAEYICLGNYYRLRYWDEIREILRIGGFKQWDYRIILNNYVVFLTKEEMTIT